MVASECANCKETLETWKNVESPWKAEEKRVKTDGWEKLEKFGKKRKKVLVDCPA